MARRVGGWSKLLFPMITSTECERKATCLNPSLLLQPLLGTDKRSPVFTVYRAEPAGPASLHVYYGAELLEVVPEDRRSPAFKLFLAARSSPTPSRRPTITSSRGKRTATPASGTRRNAPVNACWNGRATTPRTYAFIASNTSTSIWTSTSASTKSPAARRWLTNGSKTNTVSQSDPDRRRADRHGRARGRLPVTDRELPAKTRLHCEATSGQTQRHQPAHAGRLGTSAAVASGR